MIHFKNVSKSFDNGKSFTLSDFSLEVQQGETLVLLGSSGCGKTTITRLINRLIDPSSGKITINQKNIQTLNVIELRRSMGYICQGVGLFPHMTVAENISLVFKLANQFTPSTKKDIATLLEKFYLDPAIYAHRYPHQLSGGQQQRVGFARAMALEPNIILMDEPFSALDTITRHEIQDEVIRIKKKLNKTIVFVTHDLFEALRVGDRIAIIHGGKLEQIGTGKEIINSPASLFVENLFVNRAKTLHKLFEEVF
jgi:osmoprotectant transport system ATP-binding protein